MRLAILRYNTARMDAANGLPMKSMVTATARTVETEQPVSGFCRARQHGENTAVSHG
jgi:hypothetical protein